MRVDDHARGPGGVLPRRTTKQVIHRAAVAWRSANGLGLRLLGPLEDTAAREALLRKFRRP